MLKYDDAIERRNSVLAEFYSDDLTKIADYRRDVRKAGNGEIIDNSLAYDFGSHICKGAKRIAQAQLS